MANIGFRIVMNIKRSPQEIIEKFKKCSTSSIADGMNRFFCVAPEIKMINQKSELRMVGRALTVKTRPIDNLMVHKALDMAQPGDVIVIDADGNMNGAILGEIMVKMADKKGIAGYVIDGCIRDSSAIKKMDFPVFARGVTPKGPYKDGPGEINLPISCGGVVVNSGDIIVGDEDGVVVIPPSEAENLLKKALAKEKKEEKIMENIEKGIPRDRSWIDKALKEKGCEFIH